MEGVAFHKYEGLGNDFILIESGEDAPSGALFGLSAGQAAPLAFDVVRVCDRHFGVGADGVLFVAPPEKAGCDARLRVVNSDGSIPEMCGNGVRCVALHLARVRGVRTATLRLETDAGERVCTVDDTGGRGLVAVDMGVVHVEGERALDVGGRAVVATVAHAGNPHLILFGTFTDTFTRAEIEHLGPRLASHPSFPSGTNVEFAAVSGDDIDLVVWERGVGLTLACGTGACATVAAARARGLVMAGADVRVRLPGGALRVKVDLGGRATMTGPARKVFSGRLSS